MPALHRKALRRAPALVWTLLLTACAGTPESANEVLARASQAMGTAAVKTVRYSGEGTGFGPVHGRRQEPAALNRKRGPSAPSAPAGWLRCDADPGPGWR